MPPPPLWWMVISYFYCGSIFCTVFSPSVAEPEPVRPKLFCGAGAVITRSYFGSESKKKLKYYFTILFSFGSEHVSHMYVSQRGRGKMWNKDRCNISYCPPQLVTNPELLCRYNEELTQVFMSCNLMGGMFQRLGTRDTPQGSVIPFLIWALSSH